MVKSLKDRPLKVFSNCICQCPCHCLCLCLRHCLFVGQVMFFHYSDKMSKRSKVMLNIIDPYKNKLIEVGNKQSSVLKKARSKYAGPESKVTKEQIVDLGGGVYMVQSLKYEDLW